MVMAPKIAVAMAVVMMVVAVRLGCFEMCFFLVMAVWVWLWW